MDYSMLNLPPPPTEAPPKPPRRVSTIMMNPADFQKPAADEAKQPMMKRLSRVLSVRRFSKEKKELSGEIPSVDLSAGYHLDAFNGKIGVIAKFLARDKYMVNQLFQFSPGGLLSETEENNKHYIPPPPLPKLVRLTIRKPVEIMTTDQKWLLTHGFADSTLLHYACAGDQLDMVKYLLDNGADWTIVNAANKTAEAYTTNDMIRTVLAKADDIYTPLGRPSYTPARTAQPVEAAQSPTTPSPVSILKPATTGRRRQSIINDSSWADNNLRSTVHQAQVLNIRGSTSMPSPAELSTPSTAAAISPSGPGGLKRSLSAKSTPLPDPISDEEEEPIATIIPMRFGSMTVPSSATAANIPTSSARPTASTLTNTNTSTYSSAASVRSDDLHSVVSEVTAGTHNTGTSGGVAKRMSFRRKSGVINALRSRGSVSGGGVGGGATEVNNKSIETETESAGAPPQKSEGTTQSKKDASPQRTAVTTSSKLVDSNKAKATAKQAPAPTPKGDAPKSKLKKTKKSEVAKEVSTSEEEVSEQRPKSRSKSKSKQSTEDAFTELPKKAASGKTAGAGKTKSKTDADTISSASTSTKQSNKRPAPAAPVLNHQSKESIAPPSPPSPLSAAPAPPIRMMRRLSMNLSMNAVEAVSYIAGAQGETVVSTSILSADSPDKNVQVHSPGGVSAAADAKPASPRSLSGSVNSLHTANKSPLGVPRVPTVLQSVEEDGYLEAWEAKLGGSTLAKLQTSFLKGTDSSIEDANALIARAKQMEKQEAREAHVQQARAEKMQAMLSKLTPLESIATGMLLKGRTAEEVTDAHDTDNAAEATGDNEHKGVGDHARDGPTSRHPRHGAAGDNAVSSTASADADAALLTKAFHELTFKEMIWRRAGYYMNAATSDVHRSDYDKARTEAYKLGMKLMKQEFQSYATKDRWEAVEMLEEHRVQEAERRLKELSKAMLSSAQHANPPPAQLSSLLAADLPALLGGQPATQPRHSVDFVDRSNRHDSFVPFS